jgi:lipid II:glycine glycyltransferase (peptidoglycan interpeptide bridge formation enzyme)
MSLRVETDRRRWNETLLALPDPHLLQSWEWGAVKAQTGWAARRLLWGQDSTWAAASLLVRRLGRLPLAVAYVPKGPILDWGDAARTEAVLAGVEAQARSSRAIFAKIDPDVDPTTPAGQALTALLARRGWLPSAEQIQFRNTALLDLAPGEEDLLAAMKPKWRYNVRLAQRRGVVVHQAGLNELEAFYALYLETGQRDGFIVRPYAYYEQTWRTFMQPADERAPAAHLLLATVEDEPDPVAGLMLFRFGCTAWYLYGASSARQRQLMPNHLLQWEAMGLARRLGCTTYDLWGAPDALEESDPLWGVWRFKEGFGARFAPHIGAWDYPVSPSLYRGYTELMPRLLDRMRRRHRQQGEG